jgi:AraC-like DNA-binding protein
MDSIALRSSALYGQKGGTLVATFYTYTPRPPLSAYVDYFWLAENSAQPHERERALPTGMPALWIDLGGDGLRVAAQQHASQMKTFCAAVVVGAYSQWHIVEAGRHVSRMGVKFKPGGAGAFFAPPAWELHDQHVPLNAMWGDAAADELHQRLLAETTPQARFHQLERALLACRLQTTTQHPAVMYALTAFHAAPQARMITQAVNQSGLSHRRFIEVFRRDVGMTPKLFCRLRRLVAVVYQTTETNQVNWAEMALVCGYSDQSHLTREFHEFAGVCPTAYLRTRNANNPIYLPYVSSARHDMQAVDR